MSDYDHVRIRVGEHLIGVMGLNEAIKELAESHSGKTDEEIGLKLVDMLNKKNYFPQSTRSEYAQAFVREFRKFLGQPYVKTDSPHLDIVVLGPGCSQCNHLEQIVMKLLTELKIKASLEHVTDLKEISNYGMIRTPALAINGKVVASGIAPNEKKVKQLLIDFKL